MLIILPNSYERLTKSEIKSLESFQTLLNITHLASIISGHSLPYSYEKLTKIEISQVGVT